MPTTFVRKDDAVLVRTPYWEVRHSLKHGGCWDSIRFFNGSGKNLLAGPVSGRLRVNDPKPTSDASSLFFYEQKFDRNARVDVQSTDGGGVKVTVEGVYSLKDGKTIPVRFRQTYEYRDWGLVVCELDIIADEAREDVVEVVAAEMPLRSGLTDFYWRDHPTASRFCDLLGGGEWHRIEKGWRGSYHRYVPIHVVAFEKGVEGIEFMPQSDLSAWDTGLTPAAGLGYYGLIPGWDDPNATILQIAPYCVAYRRNQIALKGTTHFKWYWTLPFVKKAGEVGTPPAHVGIGSRWISDADLERLAKAGVRLVRFHNDYRKDGPFWHDGQYPPYDAEGMAHLRRIIDKCHALGMKIIPYISVKELHPITEQWKQHGQEWAHVCGPTFKEVHTWAGSGEFGQVECLQSGWLGFRKESIETILNDLPWDGLYFDWETPHPCAHPGHVGGALHTDQDAFLDFMFWVRKRVGPEGVILSHISGLPQIVVENMSTAALIYEDLYRPNVPMPGEFEPQIEFMPIIPRMLCTTANSPETIRRNVMSPLLQGAPAYMGWPPYFVGMGAAGNQASAMTNLSVAILEEWELFGTDLSAYKFLPATAGPIRTGQASVFGAVWFDGKEAWVYLGNLSPKPARGQATVKADLPVLKGKRGPLVVRKSLPGGKSKELHLTAADLRTDGIPYTLGPWASAVYRI